MTDRIYLTKHGRVRLEQRLERARSEYRAVCSENPEAREAGDSSVWHDNFAFEENQRQQHQRARAVRDLERLLARVEVVDPPARTERVAIATRVCFQVVGEETEQKLRIAGFDDSDPHAGRIGYNAPIGRALIGSGPGDLVRIPTRSGPQDAEILWVEPWRERPGHLIVFEGLDGTGKSTAAKNTAEALHAELIVTPPEPLRARREVVERSQRNNPAAITSFYLDGDLVASERARSLVAAGRDVVMDRYIVSTIVNARLRGDVSDADPLVAALLRPDLTIVVELDEAVRLDRLRGRSMSDHDVTTTGKVAAELAKAYRREAMKRDPERVELFDATGLDEEAVVRRVVAIIDRRLSK